MRKFALLLLLCASVAQGQGQSTGNITAAGSTCGTTNACVVLPLGNADTIVSAQVTGTFTATLKPEKTSDGSTWVSAGADITAVGVSTYAVPALRGFRLRASAHSSGTAVVTLRSAVVTGNTNATSGSGAPSGACTVGVDIYVDTDNGNLYSCPDATWTLASGSGTPGGSDTQVQFNDGGSFGGDAGLTYNKTTNQLDVAGGVDVVGHSAMGSDAVIDNSPDSAILTLKDTQTQTTLHAIGISDTVIWAPSSNANSRNLIGLDTLMVPAPDLGVTIPSAAAISINMQRGTTGQTGLITNFYGIVINPVTQTFSSVTNNYGIRILDQDTAGANNWALYTGAGLVSFGDDVDIRGGALDASAGGTINANKLGGETVTFTSLAANDAVVYNGSAIVNAQTGLPSRADDDGTVAIATTDRNAVVNVGHATANAVSIAEAGTAAGNGFIAAWQGIVNTTAAGRTTVTPTTSTVNGFADFTLRTGESARIFVPTESDTDYLALFSASPFTEINIELFGPGTATATGDGKAYFYIGPKLDGMTLVDMFSQVYTAGTTNATSIGLDRCAAAATGNVCSGTVADMLSVNQTVDSGENSSDTAATAVTINASNAQVTKGQVLRFNVDAISTTPAQGLQVVLRFRR